MTGPSTSPDNAVAALRTLQRLGYTYEGGQEWKPPIGSIPRRLVGGTHTIATMEISQAAFMEIHANLLGAGYEHAIAKEDDGTDMLDMTGIGLVPNDNSGPAHAEHMDAGDCPVPPGLIGTVAGRDWLLREAVRVMQAAQDLGFVLTIDLMPRRPLAMGNYEAQATVRPARGPRGDYEPPVPSGFDPDAYDWRNAGVDSAPIDKALSVVSWHAQK